MPRVSVSLLNQIKSHTRFLPSIATPSLNTHNLLPPDPSMPVTTIQTYAHTCEDLALWNHNALVVVFPSIISLVLIFVAVMSILGLAPGCLLGWIGLHVERRRRARSAIEGWVGGEKGIESSVEWVIKIY
jgi:hypothetical protein